jgi:hypothetical protein
VTIDVKKTYGRQAPFLWSFTAVKNGLSGRCVLRKNPYNVGESSLLLLETKKAAPSGAAFTVGRNAHYHLKSEALYFVGVNLKKRTGVSPASDILAAEIFAHNANHDHSADKHVTGFAKGMD